VNVIPNFIYWAMKEVLPKTGTGERGELARVIQKLKAGRSKLESVVCVTAQHREMLDHVLDLFNISPDYDLDIMKKNQSLFDITAEGLRKLENVLKKERPDIILVQGDTTTTFLASLAGYYLKIQIGHIEAGLRTDDKYSPFLEEM
jgi:UDP-N-acetylglucosamine 2-epimerase (non-hydrolysing)